MQANVYTYIHHHTYATKNSSSAAVDGNSGASSASVPSATSLSQMTTAAATTHSTAVDSSGSSEDESDVAMLALARGMVNKETEPRELSAKKRPAHGVVHLMDADPTRYAALSPKDKADVEKQFKRDVWAVHSKTYRVKTKEKYLQECDNAALPTMVELLALETRYGLGEKFVALKMEFASRDHLQLAVKQLCEVTRNVPKHDANNTSYSAYTEGRVPQGGSHLKVKAKMVNVGKWVVTEFKAPSRRVGADKRKMTIRNKKTGKKRQVLKTTTAYSASDLALVVLDLVRDDPNVAGKVIRTTTNRYVAGSVSNKVLYEAKRIAYRICFGSPFENMTALPEVRVFILTYTFYIIHSKLYISGKHEFKV